MADALVVVATISFFVVAGGYVALCERIVRAETPEGTGEPR